MKVNLAALFLCLSGVCFLVDYPAYASPLKSDNEQMEPYLEKLQANIIEEEKAVESLKRKYEDVLRKKQNPKEQKVKKENKEPDAPQSEKSTIEAKLKDLESKQQFLRQKNQELLNSLEQSTVSIQKKEKIIEELKKSRPARPKEEVLVNQSSPEGDYSKEEALTRKQLDKLQKEKASMEVQLKALKEEHKSRLARDTAQAIKPRVDKKENEKREEEIKENSFSGKSIDSKSLENNKTSCFDANQKNKQGILKSFLDKAKKLDSWWREKVW